MLLFMCVKAYEAKQKKLGGLVRPPRVGWGPWASLVIVQLKKLNSEIVERVWFLLFLHQKKNESARHGSLSNSVSYGGWKNIFHLVSHNRALQQNNREPWSQVRAQDCNQGEIGFFCARCRTGALIMYSASAQALLRRECEYRMSICTISRGKDSLNIERWSYIEPYRASQWNHGKLAE